MYSKCQQCALDSFITMFDPAVGGSDGSGITGYVQNSPTDRTSLIFGENPPSSEGKS
jgi:hypothetical protein